VWRKFWVTFTGGATTLIEWYRDLFKRSLPLIKVAALITIGLFYVAYSVGYKSAETFTLPAELVDIKQYGKGLESQFKYFGLFTGQTWRWIVFNNVRALALATLLGAFTLGVLAEILLMVPIGIIGYFAGNVALAGGDKIKFLTALVLPHAVLEIPMAVLACATILRLGLAVLSVPKGESLSEGWIKALGEWARVGLGLVLPLLLAAAAIEVFITPRVAMSLLGG
jgi:stage II sporulation protein M